MSGYIAGEGPDIVLLHGLGSRWQVFEPILPALERTHRVHAFDLPGFGVEPVDDRVRPDVAGYADWVTEQLIARGVRSPHIVGSSMGGGIALELARRGVAGQVTVFSPIGFWSPAERSWAQGLLTLMRRAAQSVPAPLVSAVQTRTGRRMLLFPFFGHPTLVVPAAAVADLAALADGEGFEAARDAFTSLAAVSPNTAVPTTIAWGRRDVVLPFVTQSARARRLHPHARHIALGGCGHLPFSDNPRACVALIRHSTGTLPERAA